MHLNQLYISICNVT